MTSSLEKVVESINSRSLPLAYVTDVYNALKSFGFGFDSLSAVNHNPKMEI